jgi:hypothetical protein
VSREGNHGGAWRARRAWRARATFAPARRLLGARPATRGQRAARLGGESEGGESEGGESEGGESEGGESEGGEGESDCSDDIEGYGCRRGRER